MLYRNSITARFSIDNKKELLPVVDESGNIIGKVERGIAHNGSKYFIQLFIYMYSLLKEIFIYRSVRTGKMFSPANGIQLLEGTSITVRMFLKH